MEQLKVSRDELRKFAIGEKREYHLPTPQACQSAAQTASQMKMEKLVFSCNQKRKMEGIIIISRIG